jgi:hypothetical protein
MTRPAPYPLAENEIARMATTEGHTHDRPVAIAPAPPRNSTANLSTSGHSPPTTMQYTCQACAKRKVKCNRAIPTCSSCYRSKLRCSYQAPLPRRQKRRFSSDVNEKLARYERILHQHGLLPEDADISSSITETPPEPLYIHRIGPETSRKGKIMASLGKSRYLESNFWHSLGDDISDTEGVEDQGGVDFDEKLVSDPLTGAFIGFQQDLWHYHPTYAEAMILWTMHIENVEPLCKILHIPSTFNMVDTVSKQPETASKADECLLFAIYHFAVFSMTEEECTKAFENSRATLMQRYHFATRQALVNASFLKTTEMPILQALVLFLMPCRYFYDPHIYWILTGVATRIAQRMGLHRDGEKLGLPPFEVQMRRRLFYQLLPLDGVASQMSGTAIAITSDYWDTQPALNLNDAQIWPGITETPQEQQGATEMIFCLARSCVGKYFGINKKLMMPGAHSGPFNDYSEAESMIRLAESEVEEKYIRYCDIVNPLHFLTTAFARAAITAMRLRIKLAKVKNRTISDSERKELFQLSQKIMDTDTAAYAHTSLGNYSWFVKSLFVWGSWESLIFVLKSLRESDGLTRAETDAAWKRVEQVYSNHAELVESKQPLQIALGRLAINSWNANPLISNNPEPTFITNLRSLQESKIRIQKDRHKSKSTDIGVEAKTNSPRMQSPASDPNGFSASLFGDIGLDVDTDFNINTADWIFWDQLIQNNQTQGVQQQGQFS